MRELGKLLSRTDAEHIASGLKAGESVGSALSSLAPAQKSRVNSIITSGGLREDRAGLTGAMYGIIGARSADATIDPLWTLPAHLATSSALTTSIVDLVDSAATSITCSTYNFQKSSGLWAALRSAARRPSVDVTVYVDRNATDGSSGPSAPEIAKRLAPARVHRTKKLHGNVTRNHAKFLVIDHRTVVITSANFSWSAEYNNVELGVRIDRPPLAEQIERDMRGLEENVYERVEPSRNGHS